VSGSSGISSGRLEPASMDRITRSETRYEKQNNVWWHTQVQKTFPEVGDPGSIDIAVQKNQVSGLGEDGLVDHSVSVDIHGNITRSRDFINREEITRINRTEYPDAEVPEESIHQNGLLISSRSKTGITTSFSYGALGRRTGQTDPRTGTTIIRYNGNHRVDFVEDPAGSRTAYTYDPTTGRKITETNADGQHTRYAYHILGQLIRTWGDTT